MEEGNARCCGVWKNIGRISLVRSRTPRSLFSIYLVLYLHLLWSSRCFRHRDIWTIWKWRKIWAAGEMRYPPGNENAKLSEVFLRCFYTDKKTTLLIKKTMNDNSFIVLTNSPWCCGRAKCIVNIVAFHTTVFSPIDIAQIAWIFYETLLSPSLSFIFSLLFLLGFH